MMGGWFAHELSDQNVLVLLTWLLVCSARTQPRVLHGFTWLASPWQRITWVPVQQPHALTVRYSVSLKVHHKAAHHH